MAFLSDITLRPRGTHLLGILLLAFCTQNSIAQSPAHFYVAPHGSDSADGSRSAPFASPERARDAIRELKALQKLPPEGASVSFEPGRYLRKKTLLLTSEDAGKPGATIVWRAASPRNTILDAGLHLKEGDFHPLDEGDIKRLDSQAAGKVFYMDLGSMGVAHVGPYPLNFDTGGGIVEFYANGERLPISRWPNSDSAKIERVTDKGLTGPGEPKRVGKFISRENRLTRWPVARGVWVEGYWRVPWDNRTVKVDSIDPDRREITLAAPVAGGIGSKYAGPEGSGAEPWWAVNLLEEIDQPGEWSVDFSNARLYWWPTEGWKTASLVLADFGEPLIRAENTAYLILEGFDVENGLANGIEVRGSHHVEVLNCKVRNLAGSGIVVQKGESNTVRSCDVTSVGQSGIVLSGGTRATLTPCNHLAENNHIQRVGILKKTYAPGILVGIFGAGDAVGCRVAHNFIHDVPHAGIQYGGNNHVFEFNEISRAVLTSDDMGAFYTTNDWSSCGNVLSHNFVHHSPNAVSFYMDDGDSGDDVLGNVCYEMQAGPAVCGGHHNTVQNNLVIRCKRGLFMDARGVPRGYDKQSNLYKKLNAVPYNMAPWTTQYPYLKELPNTDTRLPQGNRVSGNVTVACEKPSRTSGKPEELALSTLEGNLDLGARDPGFEDEAGGNLSLKKDSPVFTEMPGFTPIPFSKIGLYRDEFRAVLPERQTSSLPGH